MSKLKIAVLYEDPDVLVVNKPAGVLVHGIYGKNGPKHLEATLTDWLLENYPELRGVGEPAVGGAERFGIVHRLDRETSGVLIVARNQDAYVFIKKLFQTGRLKKTYQALVWGRVKNQTGLINKPISIKDGSVKRTVFKGKMTRPALTEYRVVGHYELAGQPMTRLTVYPKTGRTHQIRVHLNSIGHPIVNDQLYGKHALLAELSRHFLHAATIELTLPSGAERRFTAALPGALKAFLKKLKPVN